MVRWEVHSPLPCIGTALCCQHSLLRLQVYDREKKFDRYSVKDGRQGDRINFAPTLPSATAAAAAGLIMPAAFLSIKSLDAKANPKSKLWDDEAWRRCVKCGVCVGLVA